MLDARLMVCKHCLTRYTLSYDPVLSSPAVRCKCCNGELTEHNMIKIGHTVECELFFYTDRGRGTALHISQYDSTDIHDENGTVVGKKGGNIVVPLEDKLATINDINRIRNDVDKTCRMMFDGYKGGCEHRCRIGNLVCNNTEHVFIKSGGAGCAFGFCPLIK